MNRLRALSRINHEIQLYDLLSNCTVIQCYIQEFRVLFIPRDGQIVVSIPIVIIVMLNRGVAAHVTSSVIHGRCKKVDEVVALLLVEFRQFSRNLVGVDLSERLSRSNGIK